VVLGAVGISRSVALLALVATLSAGCSPSPSPSPSPPPPPSASQALAAPSSSPTDPPEATVASAAVASASPQPTVAASAQPSSSATPSAWPPGTAPLDGVLMSSANATRLPLAIMIDDNIPARPQAGFNAASIVYQAPADGGEDRYMLVFQEEDSPLVGPVRSGRPYFLRWAAEFRSAFGHYGGDAKTLQKVIPSMDGRLIYDVDALRNAGGAYHRVKTRSAPHNAYTSTSVYRKVAGRVGAPSAMVAGLPIWTFTEDRSEGERPASGSITVPYRTGTVGYAYDPKSNSYLRSVVGRAQIDAADNKRVAARNVVVLFMGLSIDPESEPGYARPVLGQIGSGDAIVFRDGEAIEATWKKSDDGGLTRFYAASGAEISLVRGPVFIQVVPTGTKVTSTFR
jgi:hypothetical protein